MSLLGHSLPMRSALVSHHVRYALKPDVTVTCFRAPLNDADMLQTRVLPLPR